MNGMKPVVILAWIGALLSGVSNAYLRQVDGVQILRKEDDVPIGSVFKGVNNVQLNTAEGGALFSKLLSSGDVRIINLLRSLETQVNLAACAPASAVTVLNAMDYKKPFDPAYTYFSSLSFPYWTQTAYIFDECVKKILGPHVYGETLEEFGSVMKCLGLQVDIGFSDGSADFAEKLKAHLAQPDHFVVANFDRAYVHESLGGHFSPIGGHVDGYMLILDVARYKYPPTFVPVDDLVKAMASRDSDSKKPRGYVAIWKSKK